MLGPLDIISIESWILLISLILLVKYYLNQKWSVLKKLNIPHDPPSILNLGHLRFYFSDKAFTYDLECKRKYGPIWGYYVGTIPRIQVCDLEILKQICITDFSNFPNRLEKGVVVPGEEMSHGLIEAKDEKWKRIRATLAPTFSSVKLRQMSGIITWCAENTLKVFDSKIAKNKGIFVAKDIFQRLSMDVICSTAFSTDINSQDQTKEEPAISKHAKNAFFKFGFSGLMIYFISFIPVLAPFCNCWVSQLEHIKYFKTLCEQIAERRNENSGEQKRIDLMQLMLDSKISESELKSGLQKGLTGSEITGNAMTMLLAGYETTGIAMTYLAYNLATHPQFQQNLQAEIDEIIASDGENISVGRILDLKYLDMCVNENLRLYCPVWRNIRTAKSDITISGLTIPSGYAVPIPIYTLCHDPDFWDEPMKFDPGRMADMSKIDPIAFQPFGIGPRNCIGSRLAMMEIKLVFFKILRKYSLETTNETPEPPLEMIPSATTTSPKVNFILRVVPRSK